MSEDACGWSPPAPACGRIKEICPGHHDRGPVGSRAAALNIIRSACGHSEGIYNSGDTIPFSKNPKVYLFLFLVLALKISPRCYPSFLKHREEWKATPTGDVP